MSWFTRGYQRGVAASAGNHWGYSVGAGTLGGLAIGGGVSYATDSPWGLGAFGKSFANHTITGNWGIGGKHIRKGLPPPKVPLLEYKPGPKIPWL